MFWEGYTVSLSLDPLKAVIFSLRASFNVENVDAASGVLHLLIKLQCVQRTALTDLRPLDENEDILLFDLINVGFVLPTVINFL